MNSGNAFLFDIYIPKMKEDYGGEVHHEIETQLVCTSPVKDNVERNILSTNNKIHLCLNIHNCYPRV